MAENQVPAKSVFGGGVSMMNPTQLADAMDASAAKDPRGGNADGSDYLNFSGKGGRYELGIEKDAVDPDEPWVVDITRFEDGWICWKESKPVATRVYPLGNEVPTPDMSEHGPFTREMDGWYQLKTMTLKSVDSGRQAYFKNNSVSGVAEFAKLQKAVIARLRAGLPAWPVICLGMEKFQAQGYTNYKPVFEIDGWLAQEQMGPLLEAMEGEGEFDLAAFYEASEGGVSPDGGDDEEDEQDDGNDEVVEDTKPAKPTKPAKAAQTVSRRKRSI